MISIPFSGSKKYCYKAVKKIVQNGAYSAVYEPFGGSCVLSVNLLNDGVVSRAVANDYDRLFDDYEEYLDLKDLVVTEGYRHGLKKIIRGSKGNVAVGLDNSREPIKAGILNGRERSLLQEIISKNVPKRLWRHFSLGGNFIFSAVTTHKEIKLSDFCLFSGDLKTDKQRAYLKALESIILENLDWRDFISKHQNGMDSNSLLILDPPYVNTSQDQYSGQFTEADTLELIKKAVNTGCDFLFFNHDPEKVKEWLSGLKFELSLLGNPGVTANHSRSDVMAYVHQTKRPEQIGFTGME